MSNVFERSVFDMGSVDGRDRNFFSKQALAVALLPLLAILTLFPFVSAGAALLLGMVFALSLGNPYLVHTRRVTHRLLAASVVGLGAGMDLRVVGRVGAHGIVYTMVGIALTFAIGLWLGRRLKIPGDTTILITAGTAICGGSAIAAVASAIHAKQEKVSVALATVFFLNAMALFIFPPLGHYFGLDETRFGLWSALAIHDTSSVVGAAMQYGVHALQIATTVKLARALWIVPVAFAIGSFWSGDSDEKTTGKAKRPWFILGFVLAAAIVTWVPRLQSAGHAVAFGATRALVLTLFLIGAGLTKATLQSVGLKPFLHGFLLWIVVGSSTLGAILMGWIQ